MPAMRMTHTPVLALLIIATLVIPACKTTYYATMEKLGYHKRDLLVKEVEQARNEQEEAKEHFQSALEEFMSVVEVDGGDLEVQYNKLRRELERCEDDATTVRERIKSIERVADALFDEWDEELGQYNSPDLRRASEKQFNQTKDRYEKLVGAMKQAESKMDPVLSAFGDQVLFLKHNLNARAIAALQGAVVSLEGDVAKLVAEMQASIDEANAFIATMEAEEVAPPPAE